MHQKFGEDHSCHHWRERYREDCRPHTNSACPSLPKLLYYCDIIMGAMASQITSLTIVSTVHSGADQRKHQSSTSLSFVRGIQRWTVNSPHKWPVTRKMFPFDDIIMLNPDSWHSVDGMFKHTLYRQYCILTKFWFMIKSKYMYNFVMYWYIFFSWNTLCIELMHRHHINTSFFSISHLSRVKLLLHKNPKLDFNTICRKFTALCILYIHRNSWKLNERIELTFVSKNNKANLRDLIAATGLVILLKLNSNRWFFSPCDLDIWWMTPPPKKNRAPLLCYFKLFASFRSHWWIQLEWQSRNA